MDDDTFTADCESCFGLCCTALSFERSSQFGHDKLGGQPCHFLEADFRCRIHARREDLGYAGCEAFDCLGAGQRASAAFAPKNWRGDSSVTRQLHARFSQLLQLQEMRQQLATAAQIELTHERHARRLQLLAELGADADSGKAEVSDTGGPAIRAARDFVRSLAAELAG